MSVEQMTEEEIWKLYDENHKEETMYIDELEWFWNILIILSILALAISIGDIDTTRRVSIHIIR